ncbi:hypothetical protein CJU89_3192 [Yarrowia sp. B02]|nr:hypothetical protein CJU89_3192 [Yarrowia sp. B02]
MLPPVDLFSLTPTISCLWKLEPDYRRFEHLKLPRFVKKTDEIQVKYARAAEWSYAVDLALRPYQPTCAEAIADFIIKTIGMEYSFSVMKKWAQFREETLKERQDYAPVSRRAVFTESDGESLELSEFGKVPFDIVMEMVFGDDWRSDAQYHVFRVSPDAFSNDQEWANCVTKLGTMVDQTFDIDSLLLGWKQPWTDSSWTCHVTPPNTCFLT